MTELDQVRLRALFTEHRTAVLAYAQRRVDAAAAEDVTSEVFVVAVRRSNEIPSNPLPWLYGVARHVIDNQHRSASRFNRLVRRSEASTPEANPESVDELVAANLWFAAAFARLTEDDREVIGLVVWEELTARELGAALGCSAPAATMRLRRARSRLRALLHSTEEV